MHAVFAILIGTMISGAPPVLAATRAESAPSMTDSFASFWAAAQGKPFMEQEGLWNRYIEDPRKRLYRSVVWEVRDNPSWQQNKDEMLKGRFARYPAIASRIPAEAADIEAQLGIQAERLRKLFPAASAMPRAVIVLAPNFDSKSGVLPDGTPVLALAADTLALENANLRILLPHELFHLYDAEHAGVKNDGVMPNTRLTLPLFEEGLATYVSSVASPGYSDGQYLFQSDLGRLPSSRLRAAARDFLRVAESMTIDPQAHHMAPQYARWFEGARTSLNPGYPNRAGYWLGLHLIRRLRRTYSLQQLSSWTPAEAEAKARGALMTMAQ